MIEARGLTKRYGRVEAVRDATFTVEDGQIVGLLGPNGAGKTTILKILTAYHFPSAGDAIVGGHSVVEEPLEVKRLVGYLPESAPLYLDQSVRAFLDFVAAARGLAKSARRGRVEAVAEDCGIVAVLDARIGELSKGYRQRVALAQAIVHDPPILILDEPTSGLDPNQIVEIRELLRALGKRKTVLLSSHALPEVEALCSQVLIISGGRVAAQGSAAELASTPGEDEVYDIVVAGVNPAELRRLLPGLAGFKSCFGLEAADPSVCPGGCRASVSLEPIPGNSGGERLFQWAVASGHVLVSSQRRLSSLEDAFLRITRERE